MITIVTDYIYGTRPTSEDAELLGMLTGRADALRGDEEPVPVWLDLRNALTSSDGRVTFEIRAQLHVLHDALERTGG
ncbi:MAG TPA: hypothetical protein VIT65_00400 [Microlunatus sp.]